MLEKRYYLPVLLVLMASCAKEPGTRPIVVTNSKTIIENFESEQYRSWTKEGNAFSFSFPSESDVISWGATGYEGSHVMISSWPNGDSGTGSLTSPEFEITKDYFNFLVGGGGDFENAYVALLIEGKEFARDAGTNCWVMEQKSWDVSAYKGKKAQIVICDQATHAWGFIMADYFYLSDKPADCLKSRTLPVTGKYINFPVSYKDRIETVRLFVDGKVVNDIDLRLTDGTPDYWTSIGVEEYAGKEIEVGVVFNSFIHSKTPLVYSNGLKSVCITDEPMDKASWYNADERPLAHFSAGRGWLNDPNGLYYYNGTWHISFQHNPFGPEWNNMHWGHAYSTDLYHWTQTDDILKPDPMGAPFSGCCVVDHENVSGLKNGSEDVILAFYTAAGENYYGSREKLYSQCLAYSNDGGFSWQRYAGNPVVPFYTTNTRDPQVVWSGEDSKWVMVLYLYDDKYAFFESSNLLDWTYTSETSLADIECPDFYRMEVVETGENLWVLSGSRHKYEVGTFSGGTFVSRQNIRQQDLGAEQYLGPHCFANVPGDRRIQVGHIGNGELKSPYNREFSFPKELSLHKVGEEYVLYAVPAEEISNGYNLSNTISERGITISEAASRSVIGRAFHLKAEYDISATTAGSFGFKIGNVSVLFNFNGVSGNFSVSGSPVKQAFGANNIVPGSTLTLECIYDNGCLEAFACDGQYSVTVPYACLVGEKTAETFASGGEASLISLTMAELEPFWK